MHWYGPAREEAFPLAGDVDRSQITSLFMPFRKIRSNNPCNNLALIQLHEVTHGLETAFHGLQYPIYGLQINIYGLYIVFYGLCYLLYFNELM